MGGLELTKDGKGNTNIALSTYNFNYDEHIEQVLEDYESLNILGRGEDDNNFVKKIVSKKSNKIYILKEIQINEDISQVIDRINLINILNMLKYNECPNIIRHYKFFNKNDYFCILDEYINNGDLLDFIKVNMNLNKPIDEEILLDIFLQCAAGLKFIHSKNIIHRNIRLENILMTENKEIKIGNFTKAILLKKEKNGDSPNEEERFNEPVGGLLYRSPEMVNKKGYGKKTDIYSLGVVFHKLCFYSFPESKFNSTDVKKNKNIYSNEIINIIELMLNKDEEKRPDANTLYDLILKEYAKKVPHNSSIEAVFRSIISFKNFTTCMLDNKKEFLDEENYPFCFNFIKCMKAIQTNNDIYNLYLQKFKNSMNNINTQIKSDEEINPIIVIDYLLEKLNKETNKILNGSSLKIQPYEFDSKENAEQKFNDFIKKNYDSIVYKYFCGKLKTVRKCICDNETYCYNSFHYLDFNLDRCFSLKGNKEYVYEPKLIQWFALQNNHNNQLSENHKIYCEKCKSIKQQLEFKMFENCPFNLIISINRGDGFKNKNKVQISFFLNVPKIRYDLFGIIKRIEKEEGEYYISINKDYITNTWIISQPKKPDEKIDNPFKHSEGDAILLFYTNNKN